MTENQISKIIIGAAIEVHISLGGPGLFEVVYEEALVYELGVKGLKVERQLEVPILYKGVNLAASLRLDLLVNNLVMIEVEAVTKYHPIFEAQLLTYLRLTNKSLGLVINFGERFVRAGIHRVVNNLPENLKKLCVLASLRLCVKKLH